MCVVKLRKQIQWSPVTENIQIRDDIGLCVTYFYCLYCPKGFPEKPHDLTRLFLVCLTKAKVPNPLRS